LLAMSAVLLMMHAAAIARYSIYLNTAKAAKPSTGIIMSVYVIES